MRASLILCGSLLCLSCGLPEQAGEEPTGTLESEIVGGVTDTGDPAVVALAVPMGGGRFSEYCTGTLIAPKTILTAAHCVNVYGNNTPYYAVFGTYAAQPTSSVKIISQTADPLYTSSGSAHDFGVLQLQTAVTAVTPIAINNQPLNASFVGMPIRHAGFGVTNGTQQTGGGTKRQVSYNVRQVSANLIESGASGKQTCSGDSGGPAFMVMPGASVETVVGVVSFGDEACTQYGQDGRVDIAFNWISSTMAPWEGPTCAPDGQCKPGCAPVDQDCVCIADGTCNPQCANLLNDPDCPKDCVPNGVCAVDACPTPDVDCVAPGGTCSSPLQCPGRVCVTDEQHPNQKYCSQACTPGGAACPGVLECAPVLVCLLKQKPVKQPDAECTAADFCAQNRVCTGPAKGLTRCVASCIVQSDCAGGTTCEGGADGQRFCRSPGLAWYPDITLPRASLVEGVAAPASGCSAAGVSDLSVVGLALGALSLIRRRRS